MSKSVATEYNLYVYKTISSKPVITNFLSLIDLNLCLDDTLKNNDWELYEIQSISKIKGGSVSKNIVDRKRNKF